MENNLEKLLDIKHGFKPMEEEAKRIFVSVNRQNAFEQACKLIQHTTYQIRSVGVFLLGYIASENEKALHILKNDVSEDKSWQVQEILAKAFDQFCADTGYEKSLPTIKEWLDSENPNVCRAVTEGLRIWTSRPFFNKNPQMPIELISRHKAHESKYLRKSVGNSLRDIAKKYPDLIKKEISSWSLDDKNVLFTYKLIVKGQKI